MEQHTIHKSIIRDFYRRAIRQGDIAFAQEIVADDYIQHSPMGKPGKAGLLEALEYVKQMPKPAPTEKPFMRLIAEGDYVATNMRFRLGGQQKVVIDVFRFQNGQVIEHWDAIQDEPDTSRNGHLMMDGALEPDCTEPSATHKAVVAQYYQRVWIDGQTAVLDDYIAVDLVQHHPDIANGSAGLRAYLVDPERFALKKVHRIIGEGNFVVVQAEGQLAGKPAVCYDTLRLGGGKIVEQWSVSQRIPEKMLHSHGMI